MTRRTATVKRAETKAAAGVALLAIVLFVVTVHFGSPQEGVYVPPRWEDDRIVPGHMEPRPGR